MRRRTAVLVIGLAATLGTVTGAVALPDRRVAEESPTAGPASSATPGSSAPRTSPAGSPSAGPAPSPASTPDTDEPGPVEETDLLTTADLSAVGLSVRAQPSDVRLELVVCEDQETLDDVASSGPPRQGSWAAGSVVVQQQAIAARDPDEAAEVVTRVLDRLEACQRRPPPYWVYGPTHTERLGPGITAGWLGTVDGSLNTTGRAPKGERINGGTAVVRHGSHVSVVTVSWCAGAGDSAPCLEAGGDAPGQLAALSRAAARRLG